GLLARFAETHDRMRLSIGRDYELVRSAAFGQRAWSKRRAQHAAAARVELYREHGFERRTDQPSLRQRTATRDEQTASALGDEVRHHRELRAGKKLSFDIRHHDGVVREEVVAPQRKSRRERLRAVGR